MPKESFAERNRRLKSSTLSGKVALESFTNQATFLDDEKHMEAFIAQEMRTKGASEQPCVNKAIKEKPNSKAKLLDLMDTLYDIPERLQVKKAAVKEGNASVSTSMISEIQEVDLGSSAKVSSHTEAVQAKRRAETTYARSAAKQQQADVVLPRFSLPSRHHPYQSSSSQKATDAQVYKSFKERMKRRGVY